MPTDKYRVVIRANKTPVGQYERLYNESTVDGVAIVIVDEEFNSCDIILYSLKKYVSAETILCESG